MVLGSHKHRSSPCHQDGGGGMTWDYVSESGGKNHEVNKSGYGYGSTASGTRAVASPTENGSGSYTSC